jgi:hypothetical protein
MTAFSVNYASWVPAAEGFVEKSEPPVTWPDGAVTTHRWVELKGSLELTVGGVTRRVEGVMTESVWLDSVWDFRPLTPLSLKLDCDLEFVPEPLADLFSEGAEFEVSGELSDDGLVFSPAEVEPPVEGEPPCVAGPSIEPLKAGCGSGSQVSLGYYACDYPALFRALRWAA